MMMAGIMSRMLLMKVVMTASATMMIVTDRKLWSTSTRTLHSSCSGYRAGQKQITMGCYH